MYMTKQGGIRVKRVISFVILSLVLIVPLCACGLEPGGDPPPSLFPSAEPEISEEPESTPEPTPEPPDVIDPSGVTVLTRFNPPEGYTRVPAEEGSFAAWLRELPVRPDGTGVYLKDSTAREEDVHAAVLAMDIAKYGLMETTDALLRLRAEYLYEQGDYEKISFTFLSGFVFEFTKWADGQRVEVDGNKVKWVDGGEPSDDHDALIAYLKTLFIYSNASAIKSDVQDSADSSPGKIFLDTGNGALIIDAAQGADGDILVMLCQGGTPVQDIFILKNALEPAISPWFRIPQNGQIITPDLVYVKSSLKQFKEP